MDPRGAIAGLALLLAGGLAACSADAGGDAGGRALPTLSGQVFDDPAADVGETFKRSLPSVGVGDVRRSAVDVADGVLSVTVALQDAAPDGQADGQANDATRYEVRLGGSVPGGRSTFDELVIFGRAGGAGAGATVTVTNQNLGTSRDLCRGRAAYSPARALVRLEVPLRCLPGGGLDVAEPSLAVETIGRHFGGRDTVDLGVRRLTAG